MRDIETNRVTQTLRRLVVVAIAGPALSVVFVFLLYEFSTNAYQSLFQVSNDVLQLGFEGAFFIFVITIFVIAVLFSIISWFALRKWGPWRCAQDA